MDYPIHIEYGKVHFSILSADTDEMPPYAHKEGVQIEKG